MNISMKTYVSSLNASRIFRPLAEQEYVEDVPISDQGKDGKYDEVGPQRGEHNSRDPVNGDDGLGVQPDGKVISPADDCQAAQVPAVKCGKGMHAQEEFQVLVVVSGAEFQGNIYDPGDGGVPEEKHP